jgi:predicted aspartyl protease
LQTIDRRRFGAASAGLALAGCATHPVLVDLAQPAPAPPDPGDKAAASLDTGADESLRVTAPVRINGQGPFDFVVDTGANRTVVSVELAAALKLPDAGSAVVHGVAGAEPAPTAKVALLQADAVEARNLRAPALPRERLGADGLLGVDVLHDRRVLIDFARRKLTIAPGRRSASEPSAFDMRMSSTGTHENLGRRIAVPARYRFGQLIIIGADVSGRSVTAFVDTGSQSTVGNEALASVVSQSTRDPKAFRYIVPVLSATGQTAQGILGEMPMLKIGGLTITRMTTVYADLHVFELWDLMKRPSLLLGMDVMTQFNAIELDYANRQVVFYLATNGASRPSDEPKP